MKTANWKDIAELIGIAAIVASLIFVGMEMRQTRTIAMAAAYQARTDSEMNMEVIFEEVFRTSEIRAKRRAGEALTQVERGRLDSARNVRFMYLENIHYQYEVGMLSEEIWRAQMIGIAEILKSPDFGEWWGDHRDWWRPSFSESIDDYIAEFSSD